MKKYSVRCLDCGTECDCYAIACMNDGALLRTEYSSVQLIPRDFPGIWKFYEWLPTQGILPELGGGSITYKCGSFAAELGLDKLYIAFNGYWPDRKALLSTCSFKDLEAAPTVQRLAEQRMKNILVVASAGNTARAFAHACSVSGQPLVIVVPASALNKIWLPGDDVSHDAVFTISVKGDYSDAIALGDELACYSGFVAEGGARNVARRDGMGTVMLEATLTLKQIPDYYFQAVGSGTGGISAWEASMRLIKDGRFGRKMPVLNLAQNLPCAPIFSSLHGVAIDPRCPEGMYDEVLFNRRPPLSVKGGVADALTATAGTVQGVTNDEAEEARKLFEKTEGIDIVPAAAVAVSALMKSVTSGSVNARDIVLLNITGGGEKRLRKDVGVTPLQSDLSVERFGVDLDSTVSIIVDTLRKG